MSELPFARRFGFDISKAVTDSFPGPAKTELAYLLEDLVSRDYVSRWTDVFTLLGRIAAKESPQWEVGQERLDALKFLRNMYPYDIYDFCEAVYHRLLQPVIEPDSDWGGQPDYDGMVEITGIGEVRQYYEKELNEILVRRNIGYAFTDGRFQRRGHAQTQKSIQRMASALSQPRLEPVRHHFNKALAFFNERPEADVENCVKEAVCALEASVEIVTGQSVKDFTKALKRLSSGPDALVSPIIADSMVKLHAYRDAAQGVAHSALGGSRVSEVEAELTLNLVASYITYLVDLCPEEEEPIPF